MDYGERLKQLRLSRDLKQSDIAELFNISTSAVGSYERCERQPTFELLHKYAKLFKVSIDYILCFSDERLTVEEYQQLTDFDLADMLQKYTVSLRGVELTPADKRRVLDVCTTILFDRF